MLYAIVKPCVFALLRVLFRLEAHGVEHVPREGPVLLVSNHSSVLDPPLIGAVTPRPMTFLAKAELFRIPFFGALIRRLNARPVRREGADAGALRTVLRVLGEHRVLLTFPEGTRGEEGVLRAPKPGAGMLAVLSGAAVIPVYVRGSGRAWPKGRRLPRPMKITVHFGPALAVPHREGSERKDHYEAVSHAMMAAIADLKERARAAAGSRALAEAYPAVSGEGCVRARSPLKYLQGRNGQHGHG
jgi:1-acyl-sn-glycerol-3-phosphate acyltransferase